MASSGDVTDEVSPRNLPSVPGQYTKRANKHFDINQSRLSVGNPDLQESMLAYSKHMRKISEGRKKVPLEVRAHHVPKHSIAIIPRQRPKIVSLNDLLIKKKKPFHDRKKSPKSAKSLPNLNIKQLSQKQLKISFVSASDLHEIIDYNIKTDKRWETSQFSLWPGDEFTSSNQKSELSYSSSDPGVVSELKPIQEASGNNHRHSRKSTPSTHSRKGAVKHPQCQFDTPGEQSGISGSDPRRERVMCDTTVSCSSSIPHKSSHRSIQTSIDAMPSTYKQEVESVSMNKQAASLPIEAFTGTETSTGHIVPPLKLPKHPSRTHGVTSKYLVKMGSLRQRPRRAKRMKLHRPELGVIPEGEGCADSEVGEAVWPAGGRIVFYPSQSSYDAIKQFRESPNNDPSLLGLLNSETKVNVPVHRESSESQRIKFTRDTEDKLQKNVQTVDRLPDVSNEVYEDSSDDEYSEAVLACGVASSERSNKLKTQKKMTKLVFLRDYPERHYHRP